MTEKQLYVSAMILGCVGFVSGMTSFGIALYWMLQ